MKKSDIRFPQDDFTIGYICGLIDGEGCFTVGIHKNPCTNTGFQVDTAFYVHLTEKDRNIIDFLKNIFISGSIYYRNNEKDRQKGKKTKPSILYRLFCHEDCLKLAEFLNRKLKIKQKDIELWIEIIKLISQKKHLEKEGILEIAKIRDLMNNSSKLKSYKSYEWFKNHFYGDNNGKNK